MILYPILHTTPALLSHIMYHSRFFSGINQLCFLLEMVWDIFVLYILLCIICYIYIITYYMLLCFVLLYLYYIICIVLDEGNLIFCFTGQNNLNFWQIKIIIILISHTNFSFFYNLYFL